MVDIIQPLDFLGRMGGMANMPNLIGDAAGVTAQRDQQAATIDALRARAMNEQAQAAQQVEQQQKAMAYQQALQSHFAAPTPQSAANLTLQFPEYAQQIKQAYDLEDAAKRDGDVTLKSEVYSRLHNGNPEAAAGVLERYIAADKAAGGDTSDEEALLADIKSGDPARVGRATGIFGYDLATIVGPEKWAAFHGGKVVNGALVDNTGKALYEAPTKGGYQLVDVVDEYGVPTGQKRSVRTDVGDVGAAPTDGAPAGAPATGSRAARNNNPGNLEASDWTKQQPGYVGTDGRFAIFDTPANGAAAMTGLLADNYLAKGVNTIGGIISKYAPASDGNNVNAYVAAVSKATGIPAGAVLTPEQLPAVQAAMAQVEGGGPAGASAAPSGGPSQVQLSKRYGNAPAGYAWNADGTQSPIKGGPAMGGGKVSRDIIAMRKEFDSLPEVQAYKQIAPVLVSARKAPDTPAGDIQLAYTVGKILDPNSVVREGELALAIKAGTPLERLLGTTTYVAGQGARMTPEIRKQLLAMLNERALAVRQQYDAKRADYEGYARDLGVAPATVIGQHIANAYLPKGGGQTPPDIASILSKYGSK